MNINKLILLCSLFVLPPVMAYELPTDLDASDYMAALGVEGERIDVSDSLYAYDENLFVLEQDATVTAFFISEGAGYHNSFGFYNASTDPNAQNRTIIWNDASGTGSGLAGGGTLEFGSSYTLGQFAAGTQLGFFLVMNGASHPNNPVFYSDPSLNPDNLQHVVTMSEIGGYDGLLGMGWEDLWGGGDKDYNDLIVAIGIDYHNAVPAPPALLLMSIGLVPLATIMRRRRKQGHAATEHTLLCKA